MDHGLESSQREEQKKKPPTGRVRFDWRKATDLARLWRLNRRGVFWLLLLASLHRNADIASHERCVGP